MRQDDGSDMCFIELVDFDDNMSNAPKKKGRTRRAGRRSASKAQLEDSQDATVEEVVAEEADKTEKSE